MFTGIISETGVIAARTKSSISVRASRSFTSKLTRGTSVAVDGACLTVVEKKGNSFSADIMPETAQRTTLGALSRSSLVNLELPATPTSFLSGHIVQGHIDGVGTVKEISTGRSGRVVRVSISKMLSRYVAPKGSIAVNGVSLTVIGASPGRFSVGIIPHTWNETSLRMLKRGDMVNIEVDVLAKYVEKFV